MAIDAGHVPKFQVSSSVYGGGGGDRTPVQSAYFKFRQAITFYLYHILTLKSTIKIYRLTLTYSIRPNQELPKEVLL